MFLYRIYVDPKYYINCVKNMRIFIVHNKDCYCGIRFCFYISALTLIYYIIFFHLYELVCFFLYIYLTSSFTYNIFCIAFNIYLLRYIPICIFCSTMLIFNFCFLICFLHKILIKFKIELFNV